MKRNKFGLLVKYESASLNNLHKKTPKDIRVFLKKHRESSKLKYYTDRLNFIVACRQRIGKTWLLHAIANQVIDDFKEKSVFYTTSTALQKGFVNFKDLDSEESFISMLAGKTVLMIDDLGLEYQKDQSDFVRTKFENFIRWRVANNKITYMASKIYGEEFIDFYGESLYAFVKGEFIDIYIEEDYNFNIGEIILKEKLKNK